MNKVFLLGNLTRNPELRYTPSGTAVCDFGLAINETFKGKDGTPVESPVFVDITAWGRQAETCNDFLSKGSKALVDGRLKFEQWDAKDGAKHSKLKVTADRVQFLSEKSRPSAADGLPPDNEAAPEVKQAVDDDDGLPF